MAEEDAAGCTGVAAGAGAGVEAAAGTGLVAFSSTERLPVAMVYSTKSVVPRKSAAIQ